MKTDPISAAHAYRMALERIAKAPSLAAAVREAQKALNITFTRPEEGHFSLSSGYGHNTKQPFVTVALANPSESANPHIQMAASEARRLAHQILELADAAESDAFLVEWLGGTASLSENQVGALLADFRAFREQHRGGE